MNFLQKTGKFLPLVLSVSLLSSCGLFGNGIPTSNAVTGKISNIPEGKTVKVALVGVDTAGISSKDAAQIVGTFRSSGLYGVALPELSTTGVYDVVGYIDANGNKQYDIGETRTKPTTNYFVISQGTAVGQLLGLKKGWNQIDLLRIVKSGNYFPDYNLSF